MSHSRTRVRTVACPACGAVVGEACHLERTRRDGQTKRYSNHQERVDRYQAGVDRLAIDEALRRVLR